MEELQLEWQLFAAPNGLLGPEADAAVGVLSDVLELVGQGCVGLLVGLARELLRQPARHIGVERLVGLRLRGAHTQIAGQHRKCCRRAGKKSSPIQKQRSVRPAQSKRSTTISLAGTGGSL